MKKMNFTFIDISCWLKTLAMLLAFGLAGAGQVYAQPPQLMVQDASGQEPSGPISRTLPEGACSYQFQWTVFVFDPAGPATANAYITTSTSSTSVNPDASLVLLGRKEEAPTTTQRQPSLPSLRRIGHPPVGSVLNQKLNRHIIGALMSFRNCA